MEIDLPQGHDISGPYVAKVITNPDVGEAATRAYAQVRAQTGTPHLAGVLEVTSIWQPNEITALLKWIQGDPLSEWTGALPLYFDELAQGTRDEMALRWLRDLCEGLLQLHQVGLVHGDVSPRNIIVNGGSVTLTDFDLATTADNKPLGGTPLYCSLEVDARISITLSDDIFALAASMFHVLFDRSPFEYPSGLDKKRGLNWSGIDRSEWPRVTQFLDAATVPDKSQRFRSAKEAIASLDAALTGRRERGDDSDTGSAWTNNEVPWLTHLLQSYPGSLKGNAETRGLDSLFAKQTYVT
ncbi:MAG: protein kinase domain-containing protein, partial [Candidatus Binatia bacterium]